MSRANCWAASNACTAPLSKCSNTLRPPPPLPEPMLLVHRLTADAQLVGDCLPRPTLRARVGDVQRFELVDEDAKGGDGRQSNFGIAAVDRRCQLGQLPHAVSLS